MKTIYKYELDIIPTQLITVKGLVKVLSVGFDPANNLCMWCVIDPYISKLGSVRILLASTGGEIHDEVYNLMRFLSTVKDRDKYMWHVFVKENI